MFDFTYDAIDLMPYHFRVYWFAVDTVEGPNTCSFWLNYRQQGARVFECARDLVRWW